MTKKERFAKISVSKIKEFGILANKGLFTEVKSPLKQGNKTKKSADFREKSVDREKNNRVTNNHKINE